MLSDAIQEHFINPRNVGEISDAEAVGQAGSLTCGATVRVSLRIDETQRITDARFKAAGCSLLIASSSFVTERVKGKTTGEAAALAHPPYQVVAEHFGLPPAGKDHCVGLACRALVSAIKQFSDVVRDDWSGDEALICTCFGVSEQRIERAIKAGGLHTIREVTRACNAGAGCRSCYSLIDDILRTVNSE